MAKVTAEQKQRIDAAGGILPFDLALQLTSPRGYRGAVQYDGHNGARGKDGKWAPNVDANGEQFERKRWTTALHPNALDALNAMAKQHGVNRCVIAEALLLSPQAGEIVANWLQPAPAPVEPETPASEPKRRKRLTKEETAKLEEVLLELINQNRLGDDDLKRVSRICGQKVETIRKRVRQLQKEMPSD